MTIASTSGPPAATLFMAIYSNCSRSDLITKEQSGWAQLSPEQIVVKDPEVIIAGDGQRGTDNGEQRL